MVCHVLDLEPENLGRRFKTRKAAVQEVFDRFFQAKLDVVLRDLKPTDYYPLRRDRQLSVEMAHKIFNVLVKFFGANERNRSGFVQHHSGKNPPHEWACGWGKFRLLDNSTGHRTGALHPHSGRSSGNRSFGVQNAKPSSWINVTATYQIPEANLDKLSTAFSRLQKRADKLGVTPPTFTVSAPIETPDPNNAALTLRHYDVTVAGEAPVLAGWTFLAVIQHLRDEGMAGNILNTVPGETVPKSYRNADPDCDHCNRRIYRKKTFVVRTGGATYKQVGSTCLTDFTGHPNPENVAAACELLTKLDDLMESASESGWGGGGSANRLDVSGFLARVSAIIRDYGWTSRSKACPELGEPATADIALQSIYSGGRVDVTADDTAITERAIEWAANLVADNDYLHNIQVIAQSTSMPPKLAGFAASIIPTYRRKLEKEKAKKVAQATSDHFGTLAKRDTFRLRYLGSSSFDSNFGTRWIHRFADKDGNQAVWWTNSGSLSMKTKDGRDPYVKQGALHYCKATVKEHSNYEGTKQTTLARLAVIAKPKAKKKRARRKGVQKQ